MSPSPKNRPARPYNKKFSLIASEMEVGDIYEISKCNVASVRVQFSRLGKANGWKFSVRQTRYGAIVRRLKNVI
jgi:hypothetical protein